jgi:hypothetical protein
MYALNKVHFILFLEQNPLLSALLRMDNGTDPFDSKDMASALADMKPTNDGERYDFHWKTWNVKELDDINNSLDLLNIDCVAWCDGGGWIYLRFCMASNDRCTK